MKNKIAALIEVRKIIALAFVALFIVMALRGQFDPRDVYTAILMVVAYYFGKSTALDKPRE
jgi:hypothetical protein